MQSENINELADALSKAQGEIEGAVKDSKNPFFKSNYADLHSVIACAREPLAKNGLSVAQTTQIQDGVLSLCTTLMHKSGQWIKSVMPIELAKRDPQSIGSAITYFRRYSYAAIVGIAQMDDDGESAMNRPPKPQDDYKPVSLDDLANSFTERGCVVNKGKLEQFMKSFADERKKPMSAIIKSALSSDEQLLKLLNLYEEYASAS